MEPLTIAIACESQSDIDVALVYVSRILHEHDVAYQVKKRAAPNTGLIGYATILTKSFFIQEQVDIAIFITDRDTSPGNERLEHLRSKIESVNPLYLLQSVTVVCDPHFEEWLLADQDCIKRLFDFPGNAPLPGRGLSPKAQLSMIHSEIAIPRPTLYDTKTMIAEESNMDQLRQHASFSDFYDHLMGVVTRE